jgi:hypothetical protein
VPHKHLDFESKLWALVDQTPQVAVSGRSISRDLRWLLAHFDELG